MESKRWNSSLRVRRYDNHACLAELSSATNVVGPGKTRFMEVGCSALSSLSECIGLITSTEIRMRSDHSTPNGYSFLLQRNCPSAMRRASVRRLVIVSTAFLFKDSILPPAHLVGRLFFPGVVVDASAMERTIAESGLDWTIVRPPQLTDKPFSGSYRVSEGHLPFFGFNVSRADVADCLIKTAEDGAYVGKVLGVSN